MSKNDRSKKVRSADYASLEAKLAATVRWFRKNCGPVNSRILFQGESFVPQIREDYLRSMTFYQERDCILMCHVDAPTVSYYPFSTDPVNLRGVLAQHFYGPGADAGYPAALGKKRRAVSWLNHRLGSAEIMGDPYNPAVFSVFHSCFKWENMKLDPNVTYEKHPLGRLLKLWGFEILEGLLPEAQKEFLQALLYERVALDWLKKHFKIIVGVGENPVFALVPRDEDPPSSGKPRCWDITNPPKSDRGWGDTPQSILLRQFYPVLWARILNAADEEFVLAERIPVIFSLHWVGEEDGYYKAGFYSRTRGEQVGSVGTYHDCGTRNSVRMAAKMFLLNAVSLTDIPLPAKELLATDKSFRIQALRCGIHAWVNTDDNNVLLCLEPDGRTETLIVEFTSASGDYRNVLAVQFRWQGNSVIASQPPAPNRPVYCFNHDLQRFVHVK